MLNRRRLGALLGAALITAATFIAAGYVSHRIDARHVAPATAPHPFAELGLYQFTA